jgi:hypothetical protein
MTSSPTRARRIPNAGRAAALLITLVAAVCLALAAPTGAQTGGGSTGSATTGGSTSGGTITITLGPFEQALITEIQDMLTAEFGPIPPGLMDWITDWIIRAFFLPPPDQDQTAPSQGSTTSK